MRMGLRVEKRGVLVGCGVWLWVGGGGGAGAGGCSGGGRLVGGCMWAFGLLEDVVVVWVLVVGEVFAG